MSKGHYKTGYCNRCTSNPCLCGSGVLTSGELSMLAFAESPAKPKQRKVKGKKEHGRTVPHGATRHGRIGSSGY